MKMTMMNIIKFFKAFTFDQAIWLLSIVYIIHFGEEFPRFTTWVIKFIGRPYTQAEFIAENIVLWTLLILFILITIYFHRTLRKVGIIMVLSAAVEFFTNMIFHAGFTLKTGVYSPGTVTACLFFVPTSFYIYYLAQKERLLTLTTIVLSIILGLTFMPIVLAVVHKII